MTKIFGFLIALLAAGLAGCSTLACGDPHPYMGSVANPPLKAPPGMSIPAPDPAYAVSGIAPSVGKPTDRNAAGVCLINPPQVVPTQAAATKSRRAPATTATPAAPEKNGPAASPASQVQTPAPEAGTTGMIPVPVAAGDIMQ